MSTNFVLYVRGFACLMFNWRDYVQSSYCYFFKVRRLRVNDFGFCGLIIHLIFMLMMMLLLLLVVVAMLFL